MKLNHLPLLFIAMIVFAGCTSNERKFNIIGNIAGMPQQTVVLEQINANDVIMVVDSTHSSPDGHFELSGIAPEMGLYRLDFHPNKFILLTIDKGNIKVESNWSKIEDYTITGSGPSEDLKNLLGDIRKFAQNNMTLSMVLDTLKARGNDSMITVVSNDIADRRQHFAQDLEHYADTTSYEPNAIFAVRMLSLNSEKYYVDAFGQSLNRRFPNTRMTKDYQDWYSRIMERQKVPVKTMEVGDVAPQVSLQNFKGDTVSLSSFKGKYVLLDFWASWCHPCRDENPNVVAAYNRFKDKNFTILGVSLDNQKAAWEKAVSDDSLSWTQVSDLMGWNSPVVTLYSIHSIPSNFLIDPTGKIIARNLRGSQLQEVLQDLFKNK